MTIIIIHSSPILVLGGTCLPSGRGSVQSWGARSCSCRHSCLVWHTLPQQISLVFFITLSPVIHCVIVLCLFSVRIVLVALFGLCQLTTFPCVLLMGSMWECQRDHMFYCGGWYGHRLFSCWESHSLRWLRHVTALTFWSSCSLHHLTSLGLSSHVAWWTLVGFHTFPFCQPLLHLLHQHWSHPHIFLSVLSLTMFIIP